MESSQLWQDISSTWSLLRHALRPPLGGRGLKQWMWSSTPGYNESPPTRGAWIETWILPKRLAIGIRRPPRGGRGLKHRLHGESGYHRSRPPRGGRGLKLHSLQKPSFQHPVAPHAGGV